MFIDAHPTTHLFEFVNVVAVHTDVRLEKITECVMTRCLRIDDDVGCFVEEEAGLLVVGEVVREA